MKKIIFIIILLFVLLLSSLYLLIFTKSGNLYIASYLEKSFNSKQKDVILKIDKLLITFEDITINARVNENSKLDIQGKFDVFNFDVDFNYIVDIKDLSDFKHITNMNLNGSFYTKGDVKSNFKDSFVKGELDSLESSALYDLKFSILELKDIKVDTKSFKIENILKAINEPIYATGYIDLNTDLQKNSGNFFDGVLSANLKDVNLINSEINKLLKEPIKQKISFNSKIDSKFSKKDISSKIDIFSNIADLNFENLLFNIDSKDLSGKYLLKVPSLSKLEEFTKISLRGDLELNGNIQSDKNGLQIDGLSSIADGSLNFKLFNDDLKLFVKDSNMKKILYMLKQDEFFDSKVDIDLIYNLLSKSGNISAKIKNGHFVQNDFIRQIDQFVGIDLSKEIFELGTIDSKIDNQKIYSNLKLNNKNSQIESKNSFIDFENSSINTKLDMDLNKNRFSVTLSNNLNKPTVTVDMQDLIKNIIEKKLDKNMDKIDKKLNKFLNKNGDSSNKELLEGIKSLF